MVLIVSAFEKQYDRVIARLYVQCRILTGRVVRVAVDHGGTW